MGGFGGWVGGWGRSSGRVGSVCRCAASSVVWVVMFACAACRGGSHRLLVELLTFPPQPPPDSWNAAHVVHLIETESPVPHPAIRRTDPAAASSLSPEEIAAAARQEADEVQRKWSTTVFLAPGEEWVHRFALRPHYPLHPTPNHPTQHHPIHIAPSCPHHTAPHFLLTLPPLPSEAMPRLS